MISDNSGWLRKLDREKTNLKLSTASQTMSGMRRVKKSNSDLASKIVINYSRSKRLVTVGGSKPLKREIKLFVLKVFSDTKKLIPTSSIRFSISSQSINATRLTILALSPAQLQARLLISLRVPMITDRD